MNSTLLCYKHPLGPCAGFVGLFALTACGLLLIFAQRLGAAEKTAASLWDVGSGKRLQTFKGHNRLVSVVAFSPDGVKILTGSVTDEVRLWDAMTGRQIQIFQFGNRGGATKALAFSPDGNRFLVCQSSLMLYEAKTGAISRVFETNGAFQAACFAADGQKVFAMGQWWSKSPDGTETLGWGTGVKEWEIASGRQTRALPEIKWSGYDFVTLAADGKTRTWWNRKTGAPDPEKWRLGSPWYGSDDGYNHEVAVSPDGSKVFTWGGGGGARLWDAESGKLIWFSNEFSGERGQIAFSPAGTQFLTGSSKGGAKLWNANTGAAFRTFGAEKYSFQSRVAFSPDGKTILTWRPDRVARLWNTDTGKETRSFPVPVMNCVAFSPDGTKIVVGEDGEFRGL